MIQLSRGVAALFLVCAVAGTALADVIPETEAACEGKEKGAACSAEGVDGVCSDSECCRLDYSNWSEDSSEGPPTTCSACLECKPAAAGEDAGAAAATSSGDTGCSAAGLGVAGLASILGGLGLLAALRRR